MCPIEWIETRSDATANRGNREAVRGWALALFPSCASPGPDIPAVEKAQEPAQLPWSSGSWIRLGHFSEASKAVGSTSPGASTVCKAKVVLTVSWPGLACLSGVQALMAPGSPVPSAAYLLLWGSSYPQIRCD